MNQLNTLMEKPDWTHADTLEAIEELLKFDTPPPEEFVLAVLGHEIKLPPELRQKMADKGWIPATRCEVWSRVMGYYRPVREWNKGKKQEYRDRDMLNAEDLRRWNNRDNKS